MTRCVHTVESAAGRGRLPGLTVYRACGRPPVLLLVLSPVVTFLAPLSAAEAAGFVTSGDIFALIVIHALVTERQPLTVLQQLACQRDERRVTLPLAICHELPPQRLIRDHLIDVSLMQYPAQKVRRHRDARCPFVATAGVL
ncbi:hypothetical protein HC928_10535 [bacterium]|nr:hypothetical protein [bacterium]